MTLTTDRTRTVARSVRSATAVAASPPPVAVRPPLTAVLARDDVYRVCEGDTIVGYVQIAGPVFVSLLGPVYNTSVEVGQCLDLESAVARLGCARG